MRICFYRPASSLHLTATSMGFQAGIPQSASGSLSAHNEVFPLTGNKGNMIHRAAAIQTIACDRDASVQANLPRLLTRLGPENFQRTLSSNFDAVVITMANAIRRGPSDGALLDVIRNINIPIYVLGLGLQRRLAHGVSELDPKMAELLREFNRKAKLFGVRGDVTKDWLAQQGLNNAQALGCPSMYVYPLNIVKIRAPENPKKFLVAGHLGRSYLEKGLARAMTLLKAFQNYNCAYVFQDELPTYELEDCPGLYDEATSRLDPDLIGTYIENLSGFRPPFQTYYSFNEVGAWRQAALKYDVYIGDRIHGGVAAMQAGIPALILYEDTRVAELTKFHGIPACRVSEFAKLGVERAIDKYLTESSLTRFKRKYVRRLVSYQKTLNASGLKTENEKEIEAAVKIVRGL